IAARSERTGMSVRDPGLRRGPLLRARSGPDLLELLPAQGRDGIEREVRADPLRPGDHPPPRRYRPGPRPPRGGQALRHQAQQDSPGGLDQDRVPGAGRPAVPAQGAYHAARGRGPPVARMGSSADKVVPLDAAVAWRRALSGRLVFTNGVFDLLHPGHVEYLEQARRLGGHLLVAVNSDRSVRELAKGTGRPIADERARARVVAGLAAVDRVVLFDAPTPLAIISALRPEVLVKGGDYAPETIVGADVVEAAGGRVVTIPMIAGYSTPAPPRGPLPCPVLTADPPTSSARSRSSGGPIPTPRAPA